MSAPLSEKQFICILCPLGCAVTVKSDDRGNIVEIMGNQCKRGETYVQQELKNPLRVLTSTVLTEGLEMKAVPVRTSKPIPKAKIFPAMEEIRKVRLKKPLKVGEVIIKNLLGLEADIIATRDAS